MSSVSNFQNFLQGFYTANELLQRAHRTGSFVESVCLTASLIDGLLRIGLVLKHQLDTGTDEVVSELLFQGEGDRRIMEKEIYLRAQRKGIITLDLKKRLDELYQERNRVVHRYLISEITTAQVLDIADKYFKMMERVTVAVAELEKEQIRRGVGMTRAEGPSGALDVSPHVRRKHGDESLFRNLRDL